MVHAAGSGAGASSGAQETQDTGASILQLGAGAVFILIQVSEERALMVYL